ncbi:uncharacterized protein LOC122078791 [Macadamia integrifolia]|uniref:uncharacterized protein LOC122078791 n=1 Tax=Macadamia integrifolia TaxID=60698 RepID=UPI001C4F82F6|nr:uncharacterized protein LOC122078791 [Macadamia integrifolia]
MAVNSSQSMVNAFKIHYNKNKDKWTLNELQSMCVQEERRLNDEGGQKVNFVSNQNKRKRGNFKKNNASKKASNPKSDDKEKKTDKLKCFFCKKRKSWFEKKGLSYNLETKSK